jgi:hypothetical protein
MKKLSWFVIAFTSLSLLISCVPACSPMGEEPSADCLDCPTTDTLSADTLKTDNVKEISPADTSHK